MLGARDVRCAPCVLVEFAQLWSTGDTAFACSDGGFDLERECGCESPSLPSFVSALREVYTWQPGQ
jgi:hypothetical protein